MITEIQLRETIAQAISGIPECVAAGFVDIQSGSLLDVKKVDSHPQAAIDLLAATAADLFQGQNVVAVEDVVKTARGVVSERHYFQEIVVNTDDLIYVFLRGAKYPAYVGAFVSRNTVNIGMMLAQARLALGYFEAAM